jgi:glycosyltransferase involved in cell wall biosynthesis
LNVAQAFPAKAQAAMITAFARALRQNGRMRLQIAGASVKPEVAAAVEKRIAEEGVAHAVDLLGHCDRRKMSRLYAEAHAFVLPSLYEGYSVSAIEAASYALPLILTDVGGAADLLDDRGSGILLPAPVPDLSALEVPEIEQLGLASENGATAALTHAFCEIAGDRGTWIESGLRAQFSVLSLDQATNQYLALIDDNASAIARN